MWIVYLCFIQEHIYFKKAVLDDQISPFGPWFLWDNESPIQRDALRISPATFLYTSGGPSYSPVLQSQFSFLELKHK